MIIKVCGMREAQNIRDVEALGPDMMGFICFPGSKRCVTERPAYLPTHCQRVGLFVNATLDYIARMAAMLDLQRLQLHGAEDADFCLAAHESTGLPITKVIPVATADDLKAADAYADCTAVDLMLLDTRTPQHGGSGERFDWAILQQYSSPKPFILAGGIGPESANDILDIRHPKMAGVDLNSRFETAPAVKDAALLKDMIIKLRNHSI